jgi:hypothetical protein
MDGVPNPLLAFGKNASTRTMAIKNRIATKRATTGKVPKVSISTSNAFRACFIQMKVAPQTRVTVNKTIAAFRRWGWNDVVASTGPPFMTFATPEGS